MADMKPQGTQKYAIESGYESGDANVKAVVSGLAIILVSTLVVMAAMFGMFNVLNGRVLEQEAKIPTALTARVVPPEPRLLPSPYTDERPEAQREFAKDGEDPKRTTEDPLPWDKRTLEIEQQYDEANAYATYQHEEENYSSASGVVTTKQERVRIPIAEAIKIMSGSDKPGTPAIMSWQHDQPILMTGKEGKTMIFDPAKKNTDESIFDNRPLWETQDEKFTNESSGGRILKPTDLSR